MLSRTALRSTRKRRGAIDSQMAEAALARPRRAAPLSSTVSPGWTRLRIVARRSPLSASSITGAWGRLARQAAAV